MKLRHLAGAGLVALAALAALWGVRTVQAIIGRSARAAADSAARAGQERLAAERNLYQVSLGELHRWSQGESARAARAMRESARQRQEADRLGDSLDVLLARLGARDSGGGLLPVDPGVPLDSGAVAASCEARYQMRTAQALHLYGAVTDCEVAQAIALVRGDSLERRLVADSTRADSLLGATDSLWRVRYATKPCTREWWVVRVPCWVQDVALVGGTLVAREAVAR